MSKVKTKSLLKLLEIVTKYSHIDNEKYCNLNFIYLKMSAFLIHKNEEVAKKKLKEIGKLKEKCTLQVEREKFFKELEEWLKENLPERMERLNQLKEFLDEISVKKQINSMHYTDEEKIDAKTFMEEAGIDEDLIEELQLSLKEFEEISHFNITLNEEYLKTILEISKNLRKNFTFSGEFKDLSLAFENLENILENLDLENIDEEKKVLLKKILDSIFEDIEKWFEEVVIYQRAKDIHYLDAALLANIEQIKILLTNHYNHDEDVEFF